MESGCSVTVGFPFSLHNRNSKRCLLWEDTAPGHVVWPLGSAGSTGGSSCSRHPWAGASLVSQLDYSLYSWELLAQPHGAVLCKWWGGARGDSQTKSFPGRENNKGKGPEMGSCLVGLGNVKACRLKNSYQRGRLLEGVFGEIGLCPNFIEIHRRVLYIIWVLLLKGHSGHYSSRMWGVRVGAGRPGKGSCRRLCQGWGAFPGAMRGKGQVRGMFWRRAPQNFSIDLKVAKRRGIKRDSLVFGLGRWYCHRLEVRDVQVWIGGVKSFRYARLEILSRYSSGDGK